MPSHYLGKNHSTTVPGSHLVVDVLYDDPPADDPGKKHERRLRLWAARACRWYKGDVSRQTSAFGQDPEPFWSFVGRRLDAARPLWIWCHSAGSVVTALGLWQELEAGRLELAEPHWRFIKRLARNPKAKQRRGFIADGDPPTIISLWTSGGQQIKILDIQNWFRCSMMELKKEIDSEVLVAHVATSPPSTEEAGLALNVAVLWETVLGLLQSVYEHDMGVLQSTISAQAMSCFRHKFMQTQIVVHENKECRKLERACLRGGRVEPFFIGLIRRTDAACPLDAPPMGKGGVLGTPGPIYHLDVSGLYPHVCRAMPVAVSRYGELRDSLPAQELTCDTLMRACARVTICSEDTPYPYKTDDQTLYVTGRFRTALCGPELVRAKIAGHLKAVHQLQLYNLDVFATRYVDYWHGVRRLAEASDDPHTERFAKAMLNSLWGKFGQQLRTWETVLGERPRQPWGMYAEKENGDERARLYRGVAGVKQCQKINEDYRHACPSLAAFVTSWGRAIMDDLRDVAGAGQTYYQATDALYVSETGYKRLVEAELVKDRQLGCLRLVGVADWLRIYGVNDYQFGNRIVRAGIPGTCKRDQRGNPVVEERNRLPTYIDAGPAAQVVTWTVRADHAEPDPRGVMSGSGWVKPFHRIEV